MTLGSNTVAAFRVCGQSNEEVAALAQKYNVELPAKGADQDKWRRRDAKDFDRDYVKKMVR